MSSFTDDDSAVLHCWAGLKLPARIDAIGVAKFLGFAEHDIPILTAEGMLKPLGNPAQNAPKYFSSVEIVLLVTNRSWLDKATKKIATHWSNKRERGQRNHSRIPPLRSKLSLTTETPLSEQPSHFGTHLA